MPGCAAECQPEAEAENEINRDDREIPEMQLHPVKGWLTANSVNQNRIHPPRLFYGCIILPVMNVYTSNMAENPSAAIFDFDGVIFQPDSQWKVNNPHAGVLGSRVNWPQACAIFESILAKNPDAKLNEYFVLNEYHYLKKREDTGENILPLQILKKAARNHISRKHELFFLSCRSYRDLWEITQNIPDVEEKNTPLPNPFLNARHLSPPYEPISSAPEKNIEIKFRLLASMLKKIKSSAANPEGIFEKIFLYYTESEYRKVISEYLARELDNLEGGRNSIVAVQIAVVE